MGKQLIKCSVCGEYLKWDDIIVEVRDNYYHKNCVELYPTSFCAFDGEDCLGETENDDGSMTFFILDEGKYVEEDS